MNKEHVLKSVHISFDDAGKATVQLQHLERLSFESEVIKETYLPHERFSLASATAEQKKLLKTAMGSAAASQTAELHQAQGAIDALSVEHNLLVSEHNTLLSEHQAVIQEAEDLMRELEQVRQDLEQQREIGSSRSAEVEQLQQQLETGEPPSAETAAG